MGVYDTAVADDGAVGYWKLDDAFGVSTVAATIGSNGTCNGNYTRFIHNGSFPNDRCTSLNADNSNISVPNPLTTTGASFTTEIWVEEAAGNVNSCILAAVDNAAATYSWILGYHYTTTSHRHYSISGTYTPLPNSAILSKLIHHYVVVFDATLGEVRTYLDGELWDVWTTSIAVTAQSANLVVGARDLDGTCDTQQGSYGNLAVYDLILTPTQIRDHYEKGYRDRLITLVEDNFTDTDGTVLAAHTPDTDVVGNGWIEDAGSIDIESNAVVPQVLTAVDLARIDAGTPDVFVEFDTESVWTDDNNRGLYYITGKANSATSYWVGYFNVFDGNGTLGYYNNSTSFTSRYVLSIAGLDSSNGEAQTLRFRSRGNYHEASLIMNGIISFLYNEAAILSTNTGVGFIQWGKGTYTMPPADNFSTTTSVPLTSDFQVPSIGFSLEVADTSIGESVYEDAVLEDSPVGYWKLSEDIGDTVLVAEVGSAGSIVGDCKTGIPHGLHAGERAFWVPTNGAHRGVVPNPLTDTDAYTVEFWAEGLIRGTNSALAGIYDTTAGQYRAIFWYCDGSSRERVYPQYSTSTTMPADVDVVFEGDRHHYVFVLNKSDAEGKTIRVYLDGIEIHTATTAFTITHGDELRIGGYHDTYSMRGIYSNLAVYNGALSPTRVFVHYQTYLNNTSSFNKPRIEDNFTGVNGTSLNGRLPDTVHYGEIWDVPVGTLELQDGRLFPSVTTGYHVGLIETNETDVYVELNTLTEYYNTSHIGYHQVCFRATDEDNYLRLGYSPYSGTIGIYAATAGVESTIWSVANSTIDHVDNEPLRMNVLAQGDGIRIEIDILGRKIKYAAVTSLHSTATKVGYRHQPLGSAYTLRGIDDFKALQALGVDPGNAFYCPAVDFAFSPSAADFLGHHIIDVPVISHALEIADTSFIYGQLPFSVPTIDYSLEVSSVNWETNYPIPVGILDFALEVFDTGIDFGGAVLKPNVIDFVADISETWIIQDNSIYSLLATDYLWYEGTWPDYPYVPGTLLTDIHVPHWDGAPDSASHNLAPVALTGEVIRNDHVPIDKRTDDAMLANAPLLYFFGCDVEPKEIAVPGTITEDYFVPITISNMHLGKSILVNDIFIVGDPFGTMTITPQNWPRYIPPYSFVTYTLKISATEGYPSFEATLVVDAGTCYTEILISGERDVDCPICPEEVECPPIIEIPEDYNMAQCMIPQHICAITRGDRFPFNVVFTRVAGLDEEGNKIYLPINIGGKTLVLELRKDVKQTDPDISIEKLFPIDEDSTAGKSDMALTPTETWELEAGRTYCFKFRLENGPSQRETIGRGTIPVNPDPVEDPDEV